MITMNEESLSWNGRIVQGIEKMISHPGDDFFDRISCAISVWIITMLVALTAGGLHFGAPLQCMYTADSPEQWTNYYNDRCYVEGTFVHREPQDPSLAIYDGAAIEVKEIQYYQWVPFVLFLQALFFLIPQQFWKMCIDAQKFDYLTIITESEKLENLLDKEYREHLKSIVRHIVHGRRAVVNKSKGLFGRTLSICHLATKWLYVLNGVVQFIVLVKFVGDNNYMWGLEALIHNYNWRRSPLFPLETFCELRHIYSFQVQHFSFQCILPWNMINEKIYIFLWFWLLFVIVMATGSAVMSTVRYLVAPLRRKIILELLSASPMVRVENLDEIALRHFATRVMGYDGLLMISLVKERCGSIIAGQIVYQLWLQVMDEDDSETASAADKSIIEDRAQPVITSTPKPDIKRKRGLQIHTIHTIEGEKGNNNDD